MDDQILFDRTRARRLFQEIMKTAYGNCIMLAACGSFLICRAIREFIWPTGCIDPSAELIAGLLLFAPAAHNLRHATEAKMLRDKVDLTPPAPREETPAPPSGRPELRLVQDEES